MRKTKPMQRNSSDSVDDLIREIFYERAMAEIYGEQARSNREPLSMNRHRSIFVFKTKGLSAIATIRKPRRKLTMNFHLSESSPIVSEFLPNDIYIDETRTPSLSNDGDI